MSNALKRQRGFSLPETVLAMALMVLTVTALGGYQRGMGYRRIADRLRFAGGLRQPRPLLQVKPLE